MALSRNRLLMPAIGMVVSACCLAIFFSLPGTAEAFDLLAAVKPGLIFAATGVVLAGLVLRAVRWWIMFPASVRPGFGRCCAAYYVSLMANNFLPARGGDLLRAVWVSGGNSHGSGAALATVALEKVLDGLSLVAILAAALAILNAGGWLGQLALVAGVVFGTILLVLVLVLRNVKSDYAEAATRGKLGTYLARFRDGLAALSSARHTGVLVLMTAAIWFADATLGWFLAASLDVELPLFACAAVYAAIGLSFLVPAGPAAVGTYELVAVGALSQFGVPTAQAASLALLLHGFNVLVLTLVGAVCLACAPWLLRASNAEAAG